MRNAWGNPQLRGMPGGIHGERWQHRPDDTYLAMGTPFALLPHWPVATLSLQVWEPEQPPEGSAATGSVESGFVASIWFSFPWSSQLWLVVIVQSLSYVSDSLWPHGLQHARHPVLHHLSCSSSCSSSQWCHPAISSSVIPFSSCLQFFPASVFSSELALWIRWPKYRSFSFSISLSNEDLFRVDFL